jgi:hypothetical protein
MWKPPIARCPTSFCASSISERFVVVGEVLRALEDYNRHTSKFLRVQNVVETEESP